METHFREFLECPVGALGGGHRDLQNLTVSTYDSARCTLKKIGDKFGFIIFDECHLHSAEQYQYIARSSLSLPLGLVCLQRLKDQTVKRKSYTSFLEIKFMRDRYLIWFQCWLHTMLYVSNATK